jgi:hypothetical protein
MSTNKLQYILSCFWFAIMSYICFGYGTGANYKAAPLFICVSLLLLYFNKAHLNDVIKPFKILLIIYIITSIGYLLNTYVSYNGYIQYLSYSVSGCITVITSFSLVRNNPKMLKVFSFMMLSFFVVGITRFFKEQSLLQSFYAVTSFYYLLFSLPLILFSFNKKYFHLILLSVTIIFCVISMKRSAIIASVFLMVMYLFIVAKSSFKQFVYVAVLSVITLFIISRYLKNTDFLEYLARIFDRLENLEEDKGSGRGDVIELFIKKDIYDLMALPDLFIGRGFEAYHRKYINLAAAHNDFIEMFFATGLFGFCCLCRFLYLIFKRSIALIKTNSNVAMTYASVVFLFFFYAFVSSNFYFYYLSMPLFLTIGALEGYLTSYNIIR